MYFKRVFFSTFRVGLKEIIRVLSFRSFHSVLIIS